MNIKVYQWTPSVYQWGQERITMTRILFRVSELEMTQSLQAMQSYIELSSTTLDQHLTSTATPAAHNFFNSRHLETVESLDTCISPDQSLWTLVTPSM